MPLTQTRPSSTQRGTTQQRRRKSTSFRAFRFVPSPLCFHLCSSFCLICFFHQRQGRTRTRYRPGHFKRISPFVSLRHPLLSNFFFFFILAHWHLPELPYVRSISASRPTQSAVGSVLLGQEPVLSPLHSSPERESSSLVLLVGFNKQIDKNAALFLLQVYSATCTQCLKKSRSCFSQVFNTRIFVSCHVLFDIS